MHGHLLAIPNWEWTPPLQAVCKADVPEQSLATSPENIQALDRVACPESVLRDQKALDDDEASALAGHYVARIDYRPCPL